MKAKYRYVIEPMSVQFSGKLHDWMVPCGGFKQYRLIRHRMAEDLEMMLLHHNIVWIYESRWRNDGRDLICSVARANDHSAYASKRAGPLDISKIHDAMEKHKEWRASNPENWNYNESPRLYFNVYQCPTWLLAKEDME